MHPVQSIGYAAAYPAYPLNPPLCTNSLPHHWLLAALASHLQDRCLCVQSAVFAYL